MPKDTPERTKSPDIIDVFPFRQHERIFHVMPMTSGKDGGDALHAHPTGQLYCLSAGIAVIESGNGLLAVLPQQIGWIPPHVAHRASGHGGVVGWAAYFSRELCRDLPEIPCILQCSGFIPLIMERLLTWQGNGIIAPGYPLSPRHERLIQVCMDELISSSPVRQVLPFPRDTRLAHMVRTLVDNPADIRGIAEWGRLIGMSERTISRRFISETGLTFVAWRRAVRLVKAQTLLAQGTSVQETAWISGYENVSAFISAFRHAFGRTPAQYRSIGTV